MKSDDPALMSLDEVCDFFGSLHGKRLDRSTVYRWVKRGYIPKPIRFGPKLQRWRRAECQRARDTILAGGVIP